MDNINAVPIRKLASNALGQLATDEEIAELDRQIDQAVTLDKPRPIMYATALDRVARVLNRLDYDESELTRLRAELEAATTSDDTSWMAKYGDDREIVRAYVDVHFPDGWAHDKDVIDGFAPLVTQVRLEAVRGKATMEIEPGELIAHIECPQCRLQITVEHGDDEGEISVLSRPSESVGLTRDQLYAEPEFDKFVGEFQEAIEDALTRHLKEYGIESDLDASGTDGDETAYSVGQIAIAIGEIEEHFAASVAPYKNALKEIHDACAGADSPAAKNVKLGAALGKSRQLLTPTTGQEG